jgi:hypothetical protein
MFIRNFVALAAASLIVANCASTPGPLPQLTADVGNSLDTVGVIAIGPSVGGQLDGPVGGSDQVVAGILGGGAIRGVSGAGAGALIGLTCGPIAFFCVPAGAVIGGTGGLLLGGTVGGISSGRAAIPENTADKIHMVVTRAIADHELQSDLRYRVLLNIGSSTTGVDLGAGGTVPAESPDYAAFRGQDIDAVLEMSLTQLGFAGEGGNDPSLVLVLTARARLIGVATNDILWSVEQVTYQSPMAAFSLWRENNSALLRAEIDNGVEAVASQIGEALFFAPST